MTEQEYIEVSNRSALQIAIEALNHVTLGDPCGIDPVALRSIQRTLLAWRCEAADRIEVTR